MGPPAALPARGTIDRPDGGASGGHWPLVHGDVIIASAEVVAVGMAEAATEFAGRGRGD